MTSTILDSLSSLEMLTTYVSCCRDRGGVLPYSDYETISTWLELGGGDAELVLLVLSDELPGFYAGKSQRIPPSLKGIKRRISKRIRELRWRQG